MRLSNPTKKAISLLLVISFSIQSCAIYKRDSVSLSEAVTSKQKNLVINNDNTKHKYFRITQIDGQYYGKIKKDFEYEQVLLSETEIKNIRPINKTATTIGNITIAIATLGIILMIAAPDIDITNDNSDF